jgi:hypothetical protein
MEPMRIDLSKVPGELAQGLALADERLEALADALAEILGLNPTDRELFEHELMGSVMGVIERFLP